MNSHISGSFDLCTQRYLRAYLMNRHHEDSKSDGPQERCTDVAEAMQEQQVSGYF
jgi:hypothetical protein